MAGIPPLFPNSYEASNRYKLDQFVNTFLRHFGAVDRIQSFPWTPGSVRWLNQDSLEDIVTWLNYNEEETESSSSSEEDEDKLADELKKKMSIASQNQNEEETGKVKPTPEQHQQNQPQGPISKIQFCEEIYHVRGFKKQHMDKSYEQCNAQNNVFVDDSRVEHCPGASDSTIPQEMRCTYGDFQEPKCVGAVGAVQFPYNKIILHFAHNQGSCKWLPRGDFLHAEQRLLGDLEELFQRTQENGVAVVDVCIYMLYQPCHKSTDKSPNVSCCQFIIDYLRKKWKIPLRIKTSFLHKIHWDQQGVENMGQIQNAKIGLRALIDENVPVSALNECDWENLWRFAVDHN